MFKKKTFNYSKELIFSSLKIPEEEVNQVLNIEKPHDFRKMKLESIIWNIMSFHSNELLAYEK
eukprot:gene13296-12126_t